MNSIISACVAFIGACVYNQINGHEQGLDTTLIIPIPKSGTIIAFLAVMFGFSIGLGYGYI